MTDKKMSKRNFLKLTLSAFAFLSVGGLSFLLPKKDNSKTTSGGYGRGGYGL